LGGAYRNRSDEDCIVLFKKAFAEDKVYALKCLFYLRDIRGGQGERRFFRVICHWLAIEYPGIMRRNLKFVPEYGRWDDLYAFIDTPLEREVFDFMLGQLMVDCFCKTPSLLAKWLKSENSTSKETKALALRTRQHFGMSSKQYRKILSTLRERIRIVERLMSSGHWDDIEFDKIPSKAGFKYRNAFARNDYTRERYLKFMENKSNKVNSGTLYPYEIAERILNKVNNYNGNIGLDETERLALQKYWDNLPNYYGENEENGIAVVDVSGSMYGRPMAAAISLGAYIAEKAHGPFSNHFITFSATPSLVEFEGVDITDKVARCMQNDDWGMNTNIEAVFDLLLKTAMDSKASADSMPTRLYIFSDMEFDKATRTSLNEANTLFENIAKKWAKYGYTLPNVVFWNLDARQDNIPAIGRGFSYVSGFSPIIMQAILSGKTGIELVLEKLNSDRYKEIV
jgi:hypothetical protein